MATTKRTTRKHAPLHDTLQITKVTPRRSGGGVWTKGTLAGHQFEALVFPEHAELPDYELADSRISKLWVRRSKDGAVVVNFDRGWDVQPATPRARAIVDALAAGLAEHVFGN